MDNDKSACWRRRQVEGASGSHIVSPAVKTYILRSRVLSLQRWRVVQVISLPLTFGAILSFFIVHFASPTWLLFTRGVASSLG